MLQSSCEVSQITSNQAHKMKCGVLILGAVIMLLNLPSFLAAKSKRVVCYHGSWSVYRPGNGKFKIEYIDPNLCTHGIYAFVGLGWNGGVQILDSWNEIDKGGFRRFNELKKRNPEFKTLVAIGGWNEGSTKYSQMANNPAKRAFFVNSVVKFVRQYEFDGFDLDWEYPAQRGGAASDKAAFSQLLKELRGEFDKYGLLLTAAVASVEASASLSYIIPDLNQYLDFINIMTYDMHGSWDPVTGHSAPLFPGPVNNGFTVDQSIQYWIREGASREKINMGIGTYGRTFTLRDPTACAFRVAATGAGQPGPYTREAGALGYNEVCEQLSTWNMYWDNQQMVPYGCRNNQFVGYDSIQSTTIKSEYAVQQGLGGIMIWSVETDDFLGRCNGVKYPLLTAINSVLFGGIITPSPPTPPPTQPTTPPKHPTPPPSNTTPLPPPTTTEGGTNPSCPTTDPSKLCTKEGFIIDPCDPRVFYMCKQFWDIFIAYRFECGADLVFDTTLNVCNWP